MKKIHYLETPEFQRDLRGLCRKYRSLSEDLDIAKKAAIELFHVRELDNRSVFPMPSFCNDEIKIYKLRKFACKALKGKGSNSGIRIVYAFFPKKDLVEFIEIYFKGDKKSEDKDRIKVYLKEKSANEEEK